MDSIWYIWSTLKTFLHCEVWSMVLFGVMKGCIVLPEGYNFPFWWVQHIIYRDGLFSLVKNCMGSYRKIPCSFCYKGSPGQYIWRKGSWDECYERRWLCEVSWRDEYYLWSHLVATILRDSQVINVFRTSKPHFWRISSPLANSFWTSCNQIIKCSRKKRIVCVSITTRSWVLNELSPKRAERLCARL